MLETTDLKLVEAWLRLGGEAEAWPETQDDWWVQLSTDSAPIAVSFEQIRAWASLTNNLAILLCESIRYVPGWADVYRWRKLHIRRLLARECSARYARST